MTCLLSVLVLQVYTGGKENEEEGEEEATDPVAIAQRMAPARAAVGSVKQLAVFAAVPQANWLAAQLVGQWVGPEAAVSDGAVLRWAPVADAIKEALRCSVQAHAATPGGCRSRACMRL